MDEICRLLYGKGAETGAETPVECPKDTGTEDVMGSTRFVYLDEDAGTGVAPYMSQPLEMSADYIGEEDEIQDGEVECNLSLEEMELLRKEQEELDGMAPEAVAVTQAVTADDLSLAGDVLMKVDGADRDVGKGVPCGTYPFPAPWHLPFRPVCFPDGEYGGRHPAVGGESG